MSDSPKITADQAVADLLRLGQKLHQYAFPKGGLGLTRTIRPVEAERFKVEIAELQRRVEIASADRNHRNLRACIEVLRDQVPDPVLVRIVAYMSWHCLSCEPMSPSTAKLTNAAGMGEVEGILNARRVVRRLVSKGDILVFKGDGCPGGDLLPGWKINRLLTGDSGLSAIWTEETLKHEKDEAERRNNDILKPVNATPRQTLLPVPSKPPENPSALLNAKAIFSVLREEVIGLDEPLMRFSTQMSLHMRRLELIKRNIRPTIGPVVVVLIGSPGSGKTMTAESFAKISGLPYSVADMSGVSQSCYVGLSLDECFYGLLANKTKPHEASMGIVVMDEICKIVAKGSGGHASADPQGRGIQAELLKPLEGCKLPLGSRRSNTPSFGVLDLWNTCFVLAGAFDGLREQLSDDSRRSVGLGFGSEPTKSMRGDIRDALVRYGFMEQLVNRIGAIIVLPDPCPEQIARILSHPNGLIAKQNAFLGSFGMRLALTDESIRYLADYSCWTKGHSRAAKAVLMALVESSLSEDRAGDIQVGLSDLKQAIETNESAGRLRA